MAYTPVSTVQDLGIKSLLGYALGHTKSTPQESFQSPNPTGYKPVTSLDSDTFDINDYVNKVDTAQSDPYYHGDWDNPWEEEELEEDDNSQFLIEGQPFNLTGYDWGG